jgi:hypothetical protein
MTPAKKQRKSPASDAASQISVLSFHIKYLDPAEVSELVGKLSVGIQAGDGLFGTEAEEEALAIANGESELSGDEVEEDDEEEEKHREGEEEEGEAIDGVEDEDPAGVIWITDDKPMALSQYFGTEFEQRIVSQLQISDMLMLMSHSRKICTWWRSW